MSGEIPLKSSRVYLQHFGVRVEPELKRDLDLLAAHGVDVAELARRALREAVVRAKRSLPQVAG